jgi:hypothetical protein
MPEYRDDHSHYSTLTEDKSKLAGQSHGSRQERHLVYPCRRSTGLYPDLSSIISSEYRGLAGVSARGLRGWLRRPGRDLRSRRHASLTCCRVRATIFQILNIWGLWHLERLRRSGQTDQGDGSSYSPADTRHPCQRGSVCVSPHRDPQAAATLCVAAPDGSAGGKPGQRP